jgi:hypothetical protein
MIRWGITCTCTEADKGLWKTSLGPGLVEDRYSDLKHATKDALDQWVTRLLAQCPERDHFLGSAVNLR